MRWKIPAGALVALAFLIPAAPAAAHSASPGLNEACQTVERKIYKDIRELVTIDLDTANVGQLRLLAYQILAEAEAESLPTLPDAIQERLNGTSDDLRAFLKARMQDLWTADLRISVGRAMTSGGANVKAAAQDALDDGTDDALLAYLNNGLYDARALDCASQPTPTPTSQPTATPSATTTVAPTAASSTSPGAPGGEGGGLPLTGADTATVASIGGALLLLGGAGYLIGRRRRSRFVAEPTRRARPDASRRAGALRRAGRDKRPGGWHPAARGADHLPTGTTDGGVIDLGNGEAQAIDLGFVPSRLTESNRRPTHYECVALAD